MDALECWAVTHPGLEVVTAAELAAMGIAPGAAEPGGLTFHTGTAGLYAANLRLRTASRVLLRIAAFHARSFAELERHAAKLPTSPAASRSSTTSAPGPSGWRRRWTARYRAAPARRVRSGSTSGSIATSAP